MNWKNDFLFVVGIETRMCVICREEYSEETEILDISGCQEVWQIPRLRNLQKLNCRGCRNIRVIPMLWNLIKLNCSGCFVQEIPSLWNLRELECANCPRLRKIPRLRSLQKLYCPLCPRLREIPVLEKLKTLYCFRCNGLERIRGMRRLESLSCFRCPRLREIGEMGELQSLYCMWCPKLLVVQPVNRRGRKVNITCDETAWFYWKNLSLLRRVQNGFRRRLNFLIYVRTEKYSGWLYGPEGPFGRKSLKVMERMVFWKDE